MVRLLSSVWDGVSSYGEESRQANLTGLVNTALTALFSSEISRPSGTLKEYKMLCVWPFAPNSQQLQMLLCHWLYSSLLPWGANTAILLPVHSPISSRSGSSMHNDIGQTHGMLAACQLYAMAIVSPDRTLLAFAEIPLGLGRNR